MFFWLSNLTKVRFRWNVYSLTFGLDHKFLSFIVFVRDSLHVSLFQFRVVFNLSQESLAVNGEHFPSHSLQQFFDFFTLLLNVFTFNIRRTLSIEVFSATCRASRRPTICRPSRTFFELERQPQALLSTRLTWIASYLGTDLVIRHKENPEKENLLSKKVQPK